MSIDVIVVSVIESMSIHIHSRFDFADIYDIVSAYVHYREEIGRLKAWYEKGRILYRAK